MKKQHILLALCAIVSTISTFCMEESTVALNLKPVSAQVAPQKTEEERPASTSLLAAFLGLMTPPPPQKDLSNSEQIAQLLRD